MGIFLCVGPLVAAWAASGSLALLVDAGLGTIPARLFLPGAALACAVISFATGSSWATAGTAGVALIGVAQGLGLPLPVAAGAIVAGAHFGDKLSPLSETAALASAMAGANLFRHVRHVVYTTAPAFVVSLALYAWLGAPGLGADEPGLAELARLQSSLHRSLAVAFRLHPALWAPPAIVLAAAVLRWPVIPSLVASTAVASALAVWLQGMPVAGLARSLAFGYRADLGDPRLNAILQQGGIAQMLQIGALAISFYLAAAWALRRPAVSDLASRWVARLPGKGGVVLAAVLACLALMLVSGSSYLAIVAVGQGFASEFRRRGLAPENLSRTLEDSATMVAPLIPWGVSGLFMTRTLGVPTVEYLPYAAMNYLGFTLAALYGYRGWFLRPR